MSLPDRGPAVFTVCIIMAVLTTAFTGMRAASKFWIRRKADSDDWFTILAWLFTAGMSISVICATRYGLGKPDSDILPEWEGSLKKAIYAFTIFYNPSLMATKTAILLLYIRMAVAHPFFRYASMGTLGVVVVAGIVLTFLNIFSCHPVSAAFTEDSGTCIDLVSLYLSSAPVNILTDLAILCLPLPILTSLRMEFRQKLVLVITFVTGGFATVVDIVRIYYLQSAFQEELSTISLEAAVSTNSGPANFVYEVSFSLMWSVVEVSVGLMCCCALVLKPLVMRVLPSMLHDASRIDSSPESFHLTFVHTKQPASPSQPIQEMLECNENDENNLDIFAMFASGPPEPQTTFAQTLPVPPTDLETTSSTYGIRRHSVISQRISRLSQRRNTQSTQSPGQQPTQTFFDFVNMGGKKPLTQLKTGEAWWPVLFVSILFFLWGFAYGLLGTLNGEIQAILDYTASQSIAIRNAYWIGYFIGPPTIGYQTLSRWGFKATFMSGLAIYAIGAMSFWPSSVLASFTGFFISNVIISIGLSLLEIAANPFIALAGPGEYAVARLNFAQGIQGIGGVLSPILASKALFTKINGQTGLFDVQWCYLAVALFVAALAVVFFYVPLSEASDDELERVATQRFVQADVDPNHQSFGLSTRKLVIWSSIFMMFLYTGAQETVGSSIGSVLSDIVPSQDPIWIQAIAHAVFALGRFLASFASYLGVPCRYILIFYISGAFLTSLLTMILPKGSGSLSALILLYFFESAIFPTLFAMAIKGQGKHTKLASTRLIMAIIGGAIFPSIAYGIDISHPDNPRYAFIITIVLYGVSIFYPIGLSTTKTFRRWVDPKWSRRKESEIADDGKGLGTSPTDSSPKSRTDRVLISQLGELPEIT